MAKLKIISQSLPTRCEICHQTDQFDANTGYCSRCFVMMIEDNKSNKNQFINLSKAKKISKPREVTLQVDDGRMTISYSTFDKDTILGLSVFLLVISAIIYFGFYWVGGVLALIMGYALLATILNKRVIQVNKDKISVWEGPFPMGINKEVKVNLIKHLFYKKNSLDDYQLQAVLINNNVIEILPNIITKKIAKYLKNQLEKYLDIPAQPTPKQLKKSN